MTHVVLVGAMGSGKSTVGLIVAGRTGRRLVDVDVAITERTGRSVREIWEDGGEAAFRHLESAEVLAALGGDEAVVVAAPGGVVVDPDVQAALRAALVVWLRADPAILAHRVRPGDHRPLLGARPGDVLPALARERRALYERLADAVVDVDALTPAAAADAVVRLVQQHTST